MFFHGWRFLLRCDFQLWTTCKLNLLKRKFHVLENWWMPQILYFYMLLRHESVGMSGFRMRRSPWWEIFSANVYHRFHILPSQHVDSSGASLLYFSWIKTQVCCLSVLSASGTYYRGMGAQAWIIRITGGLVEGRNSYSKANNSKHSFYPHSSR